MCSEEVQRTFTKRIEGMENLPYRERLSKLKMYSQERRRDRYMCIFVYKIAMNIVSGYKLEFRGEGSRRGRECEVAEIVRSAPAAVRKARQNSLSVKGTRLFNLLPADIRNINSNKVEHFKKKLDKFLQDVPDEPDLPRASESNCLLHQIPMYRLNRAQN